MRSLDYYVGMMEGIFSVEVTDEELRRAIVKEILEELIEEWQKPPL